MKYLVSYRESMVYDDAVTMARYQLFDATTTMSFYFNDESFTNVKDIKILIEKYNEFFIKESLGQVDHHLMDSLNSSMIIFLLQSLIERHFIRPLI